MSHQTIITTPNTEQRHIHALAEKSCFCPLPDILAPHFYETLFYVLSHNTTYGTGGQSKKSAERAAL